MTNLIRIMLADDHSQVHRSLSIINDTYPNLQLIAHASNGVEAIEQCDEYLPDVILMDVIMPGMNGIEATRIIHQRHPQVKILALSSFQDGNSVQDMIEAGASGYVLKNSSLEELVNSIRAVQSGKTVFSMEVTHTLFGANAEKNSAPSDFGLSPREFEVLGQMVKGLGNKEVAHVLTISEATVKFHVRGILAKLNVSSRVEAVAIAVEKHLIK
jgi:NarL family two-component system response regulator LiaR